MILVPSQPLASDPKVSRDFTLCFVFAVTRATSDRGEPLDVADGRYETVTSGQNKKFCVSLCLLQISGCT